MKRKPRPSCTLKKSSQGMAANSSRTQWSRHHSFAHVRVRQSVESDSVKTWRGVVSAAASLPPSSQIGTARTAGWSGNGPTQGSKEAAGGCAGSQGVYFSMDRFFFGRATTRLEELTSHSGSHSPAPNLMSAVRQHLSLRGLCCRLLQVRSTVSAARLQRCARPRLRASFLDGAASPSRLGQEGIFGFSPEPSQLGRNAAA